MAELNFEEMLSQITQNPDLMNKISQIAKASEGKEISETLPHIIDAISPTIKKDNAPDEKIAVERAEANQIIDAISSKSENGTGLTQPLAKLSEKITKNAKLLMALKPYLNKERGDIIDSVVKIAQISDLMKLAR